MPGGAVRAGLTAMLLAVAALLCALGPGTAAAACPNEGIRVEQQSGSLPDCRAYELVTPNEIPSLDSQIGRASTLGGGLTFYTTHPASDAATSSYFYLATRGQAGWTTQSVGPQSQPAALFEGACEENVFFAPDLRHYALEHGWYEAGEAAHCKRASEIVAGEPTPYRNVLVHDVEAGTDSLVNAPPTGATPANAKFEDASDDFSRVVFAEEAQLLPGMPAGNDFYLWASGSLLPLTVLPDGTTAPGELVEGIVRGGGPVGSGFAPFTGALSADGTRAFFYSGSGLYLRLNADRPQSPIVAGECTQPTLACTVQVDASHGPGVGGGGVFWRAASDGSRAFFTADSRLTADSGAESGKPDLYEFEEDGTLTDLTPGTEPADVRGVSGAAEDGSYVYFVANGVLDAGASPGTCSGSEAAEQACNLYVAHDGSVSFVARLPRSDRNVWQEATGANPRRKSKALRAAVSANGRFLAFVSTASLTGYDNRDVVSGEPDLELFLYDASADGGAGRLTCVSCLPGGARPGAPVREVFEGNYGPTSAGGGVSWAANVVLDDGTVFFADSDPLVGADTNGQEDVYEYRDGKVALISGGSFPAESTLLAASPSGEDVFLRTPQPLVAADRDSQNISIYDARVDGGFPPAQAPAPPCDGEACRGAVAPAPVEGPPATVPIAGAGHKPRCRRGHRASRRPGSAQRLRAAGRRCAGRRVRKPHRRGRSR